MDCATVMTYMTERLLRRKDEAGELPEPIIQHIAGCRACLAELDAISMALTGEPSNLKANTDLLLTCEECLDRLPAYADAEIAGLDLGGLYPEVAHHLQVCTSCREQYAMLLEMLQATDAEVSVDSAGSINFAQLPFERDEASIPTNNKRLLNDQSPTPSASFWQRLQRIIFGSRRLGGALATSMLILGASLLVSTPILVLAHDRLNPMDIVRSVFSIYSQSSQSAPQPSPEASSPKSITSPSPTRKGWAASGKDDRQDLWVPASSP